MFELLTEK